MLSLAEKEEQEMKKETNNLINKTEFNVKKKAEYKKTITRSERLVACNFNKICVKFYFTFMFGELWILPRTFYIISQVLSAT